MTQQVPILRSFALKIVTLQLIRKHRLFNMASFAQRLAKAQSSLPPAEEESIEHLTMEDLKGELMTFGKAHVGKPYEEIWANHPDWVRWFAAHYFNSSKMEHRKMIRYIHLKIEETENTEGPTQMPIAKAKSLPKSLAARPKVMPASTTPRTWPVESETDPFEVMSETPWIAGEEAREEMHGLQARMLNMENAMQRLIALMSQSTMGADRPMPAGIPETATAEWDEPWNN